MASANATATGGNGGFGTGAGQSGGAGGASASAKAVATGSGTAFASVTQKGGAGGRGNPGATGGNGASSTLTDAVSGSTLGGHLTLQQTALGGFGGAASGGGAAGTGGAAASSLSITDTTSATVNLLSSAIGETGGTGTSGSSGGGGGAALASLNAVASGALSAGSSAIGGSSGTGGPGGIGRRRQGADHGPERRQSHGHGERNRWRGPDRGRPRLGEDQASGLSGPYDANANTSLAIGQLIQFASADAGGTVDGAESAKAKAIIGDPSSTEFAFGPNFEAGGQAVALIDGAPNSTTTTDILAANSNIASKFGASPVFFASGELGGAHASSGGTGSQTITDTVSLTVDLTQLPARHDLMVGLFNPTVLGSGFTSLTVDLSVNGASVVHDTLTSVFEVDLFFSDSTVDLSTLDPTAMTGSTLDVTATVTLTTSSAGQGFYGGFIIGDPPAAPIGASSRTHFAQAMAGMSGGSGPSSMAADAGAAIRPPMLAAGSHLALA